MNFKHDLLLIDLETTGLDVDRHEIIQIAAVLLDKRTLEEKKAFSSYIRPSHWGNRDKESMKVNKIRWETVKNAPMLKEVLMEFHRVFRLSTADKPVDAETGKKPWPVILSYYGGPVDIDFLRAAYRRSKIEWRFDYHYFNLWAVFYAFLAVRGQLKNKKKFAGFELNDLLEFNGYWKIEVKGVRHDALGDCRIEAEIMRQIIKVLS